MLDKIIAALEEVDQFLNALFERHDIVGKADLLEGREADHHDGQKNERSVVGLRRYRRTRRAPEGRTNITIPITIKTISYE